MELTRILAVKAAYADLPEGQSLLATLSRNVDVLLTRGEEEDAPLTNETVEVGQVPLVLGRVEQEGTLD